MRAAGTPARRRGRILAGSGIGGSISSVLLSAVLHSWLPFIVVGSLVLSAVLIVGAAVLIPIIRGATPNVECGSFKLTFDNSTDGARSQITKGDHR